MPWMPGSDRSVPGSSPGNYISAPWKIVIHSTEGSSAEGAFGAYQSRGIFPHFTVDQYRIYQHIDSSISASAVLNESGGVETNRARAIQIEMVGFADSPKNQTMLGKVAEVCAWVEEVHGVAHVWPAGRPKGSGGPHNRSSSLWMNESGYYGHSQVPENSHYDPGALSDEELDILMGGVVERIRVRINDADQTETVKGWLHDANSVMDVSDWCAFSRTPVPVFDNSTKDDDFSGTLNFWTHKTVCQAMTTEGTCGKPSIGLVAIPLPGAAGTTILQSLCADHAAAVTAPPPPTPPVTPEPAPQPAQMAATPITALGGTCPVDPPG